MRKRKTRTDRRVFGGGNTGIAGASHFSSALRFALPRSGTRGRIRWRRSRRASTSIRTAGPLLGRKLRGKSRQELRDFGLLVEQDRDLIEANSQPLFAGMGRLSESSLLDIKNKSHAMTAEIVVPENGAKGVVVAQGGAFGGWWLYLHDARP